MRVLHVALTPLAGSPIRIVNALNAYSDCSARLVVLNPNIYGNRVFPGDLAWHENREEVLELLETADVLHFHHWFDLRSNPFGFDFVGLLRKYQKIVRQFHSTPYFIARGDEKAIREITESKIPHLVIAQHPERYYPKARVVPNIVPIWDDVYLPVAKGQSPVSVFYSPSVLCSAWHSYDVRGRWDTKGFPETRNLLKRIKQRIPSIGINIQYDIPHQLCLEERRNSHFSIDDMVTGGYHLSSLESLSQGVPTFAWLDDRTRRVIEQMTGTSELPWLNYRLEDAEAPLVMLFRDPGTAQELGQESRAWMEKYWDPKKMVQCYVGAYEDLFENPESFYSQRFDLSNAKQLWHVQLKDDMAWIARCNREMPLAKKIYRRFVCGSKIF